MSTVVEQIKERLNIVDVISSYIKVDKAGINFRAKCPFHSEKTPSFFISPTRQTFYCFGCGEKGDIFSFVQKFEGLDFRGALKNLASRAGVELKDFRREERPEEKDKLFEIMEEAAKVYEGQLKENKGVLKYLEGRGLNSDSISKWRLGSSQDEWRSLHDYLIQKGFSRENMSEAGLIKKADSSSGQIKYYDTFRNRVMFPIFDPANRVIAFSGRALKESEKIPKYLNSPETTLFHKSEVLYGFNIAKNYIRKLDYAILVEGQMDLIMSHQAGIFNTVASSGTALTESHLKKTQKFSNRVIVAYDSDSSGEKASRRAAELALSLGMEVKIASLPKGEDPASVAKKNPQEWKRALKESEHFTDFILDKTIRENRGKNLAREIMSSVLPVALLIKSDIERTQFIKKITLKIKVREEDVWNDLKRVKTAEETFGREKVSLEYPRVINLERLIIGLIFLEKSLNKRSSLKTGWQKISGKKEVEAILESYEGGKEALIFEAEIHASGENMEKIKDEILKRIELENLRQKLQEITIRLDDKNISKGEEKKLKTKFERIQRRIKELNN